MEVRVLGKFVPFGKTFLERRAARRKDFGNPEESQEYQFDIDQPSEPRSEAFPLWDFNGSSITQKITPTYKLYNGTSDDIEDDVSQRKKDSCQEITDSDFDEELYVKDKTVIWSKGNVIKKSFTFQQPVKQALFVWFNVEEVIKQSKDANVAFTNDRGTSGLFEEMSTIRVTRQRCVCIMLQTFAKIYYPGGKTQMLRMPFPVREAVALKTGLLLSCMQEEESDENPTADLPTLYSLLDPLDEIRPVSVAPKLSYFDNHIVIAQPTRPFVASDEDVIFVNPVDDSGSFIVLRNRVNGLFSVCRYAIRKEDSRITFEQIESRSRRSSYGLVRQDSTMSVDRFLYPDTEGSSLADKMTSMEASPEIYLEYIETDIQQEAFASQKEGNNAEFLADSSTEELGDDSTAFIAHDNEGQEILCIHTKSSKCVTLISMEPWDGSIRISKQLNAKAIAAVPIMATRMGYYDILILDLDRRLHLWTGNEGSLRVMMPILVSHQNLSPSKQCLCYQSEALYESMTKQATYRESVVISLRDSVNYRVNLILDNQEIIRASLNFVTRSTLVRRCINALSFALSAEDFGEFYQRYLYYQFGCKIVCAPQSSEWDNFLAVILSLIEWQFENVQDENRTLSLHPEWQAHHFDKSDPWKAMLAVHHYSKIKLDTVFQCLNIEQNTTLNSLKDAFYRAGRKADRLRTFFNNTTLINGSDWLRTSLKKGDGHDGYLSYKSCEAILCALHLVLEDLRLDVDSHKYMDDLLSLLLNLAVFVSWEPYKRYYEKQNANIVALESCPVRKHFEQLPGDTVFAIPPDIYKWILTRMRTEGSAVLFPTMELIESEFSVKQKRNVRDSIICVRTKKICAFFNKLFSEGAEAMVLEMATLNFKMKDVDGLPFGIGLPLKEAIRACRKHPPDNWPGDAYVLIGREDLAELTFGIPVTSLYFHSRRGLNLDKPPMDTHTIARSAVTRESTTTSNNNAGDNKETTGTEFSNHEITDLRFDRDRRLTEVQRLLQSSNTIKVDGQPGDQGSADVEISAQQIEFVQAQAYKNFAHPVGRAILTYGTSTPIATESFPITHLPTTMKIIPNNTVIALDKILRLSDISDWPEFHQGAAAGMRISPDSEEVDGSWITLNKPAELNYTHAGFLLGLGLNGHLRELGTWRAVDYLMKTPKHDATSIALVIGLAASFCGSMDTQVTKLIAVHIPALLPPNSSSLNVSSLTQTAAVFGIGLLYMGTCNRRMAQVMLSEIAAKNWTTAMSTDLDYSEGYSLAAGLSLGLITLGKGDDAPGLADLNIMSQLRLYMIGNTQTSEHVSSAMKNNADININVTSLGSTIALGLMYLKTNNASIAKRIPIPETAFFLDYVRPDFLLARILARHLIMWDNIEPTLEWVESDVPSFIKDGLRNPQNEIEDSKIESFKQAYYSVIAGSCFSLALKYAGSADEDVLQVILHHLDRFLNLVHARATLFDQQITRMNIKTCLNVLVTCAGIVMAGTGNLEVLRRLRKLHRPDISHVASRSYGAHMATGMALGFLFLGGGTYTLGTSDKAVAALLCSLFFRWPADPIDNRSHLQAFRHLWVLAIEPRCLIVRDVETREACHVPVTVVSVRQDKARVSSMVAPCLLPESKFVVTIEIDSPRYWPIWLNLSKNKDLRERFWKDPTIYVKRKTGHLSYSEDPQDNWNLLSRLFPRQTLAAKPSKRPGLTKMELVKVFSADPQVLAFASHLCDDETDRDLAAFCTGVLRECLSADKPEAIHIYLALYQNLHNPKMDIITMWNIKLILVYYETVMKEGSSKNGDDALIQVAFIHSVRQQMDKFFSTDKGKEQSSSGAYAVYNELLDHDVLKAVWLEIQEELWEHRRPDEFSHDQIQWLYEMSLSIRFPELSLKTVKNIVSKRLSEAFE